MAAGFTIDVDATAVLAALASLGEAAQPYVNEASHQTADAIVSEAKRRLQRKLGPTLTPTASRPDLGHGLTLAGILDKPAYDGNGYVVISGREPFGNLPLWLEKGTRHGKAGSHASPALAYFYSSCQLEEGPHRRRIQEAVAQAIADRGLGD